MDHKEVTTDTIGSAEAPEDFSYSASDYTASAKKLTVSPKKPKVDAYGATISFGEYGLEESKPLKIKKLPEKVDASGDVKVTAYDFDLDGQTEFEDVILITMSISTTMMWKHPVPARNGVDSLFVS